MDSSIGTTPGTGVHPSHDTTQPSPAAAFTAQTPSLATSKALSSASVAVSVTTSTSEVAAQTQADTATVCSEKDESGTMEEPSSHSGDLNMESSTPSSPSNGNSAPESNSGATTAASLGATSAPTPGPSKPGSTTSSSKAFNATSNPKNVSVAQTMTEELEYNKKHNPLWKPKPSARAACGRQILSHLGPKDVTAPKVKKVDKEINVSLPTSQLNHFFECQICYSIINDTRCIKQCLHRFCQDCMEQSLRVLQNECPSCRARVPSRRSCQQDQRFDALIALMYPDREKYEALEKERLDKITAASREHTSALAQGADAAGDLRRKRTADSDDDASPPSSPAVKRRRSANQTHEGDGRRKKMGRPRKNEVRGETSVESSEDVFNARDYPTQQHWGRERKPAERKEHKPSPRNETSKSGKSGDRRDPRVYVSFRRHARENQIPDVSAVTFLVPVTTKVKSLKRYFCKRFRQELIDNVPGVSETNISEFKDTLDFSIRFEWSGEVAEHVDDAATIELLATERRVELIPEDTKVNVLYMRKRY
eukprot:gb/GECG01008888.1/.p1 GENE.gb/GECG01008888.1/~~gb/GECG01008888.1/.p1  ORF type:complete len:538 (+),score=72.70 gb/GECG01008888.1/:1-1614(+)